MFSKPTLIVIAMFVFISAVSGFVYQFHYKPLSEKQEKIIKLEEVRDIYAVKINDIGSKLYTAENNNTTQNQQGYIDAIGDENETFDTSTLDTLFTK